MTQMTASEARETIEAGSALPENVVITTPVDWEGFTALTSLPSGISFWHWADLSHCPNLRALPSGMKVADGLDLSGNNQLTELPADLEVGGWLKLDRCGIMTLPEQTTVAGYVFHCGHRAPYGVLTKGSCDIDADMNAYGYNMDV